MPEAVGPAMRIAAGRASGSYDAHVTTDGVLRTQFFRRLERHPFYVNVGLAHDDYLADWRWQVALAALLRQNHLEVAVGYLLRGSDQAANGGDEPAGECLASTAFSSGRMSWMGNSSVSLDTFWGFTNQSITVYG